MTKTINVPLTATCTLHYTTDHQLYIFITTRLPALYRTKRCIFILILLFIISRLNTFFRSLRNTAYTRIREVYIREDDPVEREVGWKQRIRCSRREQNKKKNHIRIIYYIIKDVYVKPIKMGRRRRHRHCRRATVNRSHVEAIRTNVEKHFFFHRLFFQRSLNTSLRNRSPVQTTTTIYIHIFVYP